jgi:hypothetical protein
MDAIYIWLSWTTAMLLAMMPLSVLLIARKVDKVRSKKWRAKRKVHQPSAAGEDLLDYEEARLCVEIDNLTHNKTRQRYDKDMRKIV